ncbi:hypothetical protein GCM10009037_26690 [Halarchaeum grantii]|uniref:PD-(D/E)XK endonuclease-like domain-containing protein n=1 Tax=Halarchaeum grantii TaxID=1193105 RepID=A0A830FFF8_9EURY|nr:PD-(D/E)XK nuclease family protein [Halarchaeum grantii]GGL41731.1 hypothetical protein GCM10009037_26690 [Halarchaeum grantii]
MTERTLFIGPNQQKLEEEAFDWAHSRSEDGIGRVLYLSSASDRHERVQASWAASRPPLSLTTDTLPSLVYEAYEKATGPHTQLPEATDRRALELSLDSIIADRDWLSSQSHAPASLVDAFDRRFARFQNVGLTTPALVREEFENSELPARIRDTTVAAYETYYERRQSVSEPWTVTYSHAFETIADADFEDLYPHVDVIVVSGFFDPGALEQQVLEALFTAFPTAAVLPTFTPDGAEGVDPATETIRDLYRSADFDVEQVEETHGSSALSGLARSLYQNDPPAQRSVVDDLTWRELPTPEREARFVARDIKSQLATDETTDIGVVIPGFEAYEGYFADAFETFDLEYSVETSSAPTDTFVGTVVENLVSLSEPEPRAATFTELVTNPLVDVLDTDAETDVVATERRVDSARLQAVRDHTDREIASAIDDLLDTLESLHTGSLTQGIEAIRTCLAEFGIESALDEDTTPVDVGRERAALDEVRRILASFEEVDDASMALSPGAAVRRALHGASLNGYRDTTGQVTILNHLDATGFAFDQLYLVGLTSEHFPAVRRHAAFFERMVDAHPILEVLDDRLRDRYIFATLLANAGEVTLTTPETDPDATAVVRSPILDELQRVTDIEPETGVDDRVGSREDLQRHIAPRDDRREAIDAAGERGDFTATQTIRANRGSQCASERADPDLSPHDGLLEAETVAEVYPKDEREPYSASRIERYVNCGFQFYMEHVLDVEDDDGVERTPDPLETGTFVHDTFERFYADLQDGAGDGVDLAAYDRDRLEAHMLDVALDELASADFEYSGVFYRRWLEQFFAGLGDPDENPHYGNPRPHQGVDRGLFVRFVEREHSRNGDALPTWFEAPFGEGLRGESGLEAFEIDLPNGGSVAFHGYIDRIDVTVDADDAHVQLFDYKTGSTPAMTTTTGGTTFQLPLYLLAAEEVLAGDIDDFDELSATYYQTKPPNRFKEPRGIESKFDSTAELRRFLDEVVPQRLQTVSSAIEHGRFYTTLLSQREAGCEYCSYRRACDVRPNQRRERVNVLNDDSQSYVPVRATARDFAVDSWGESDD